MPQQLNVPHSCCGYRTAWNESATGPKTFANVLSILPPANWLNSAITRPNAVHYQKIVLRFGTRGIDAQFNSEALSAGAGCRSADCAGCSPLSRAQEFV